MGIWVQAEQPEQQRSRGGQGAGTSTRRLPSDAPGGQFARFAGA